MLSGAWERLRPFLVFPTPKFAVIRDPRLAVMRYLWGVGVLSYVLLYQLLYMNGYLQAAYVTGTVQMSLSTPLDPDCAPDAAQCRNALAALTDLAYCTQSSDRYSYEKLPCAYLDAVEASTNLLDSMMVATRISQADQELVCAAGADDCPWIYNQTAAADIFYVADADALVLQLSHYVMAPEIDRGYYSRDITGKLYVEATDALCAAAGSGATQGLWDDTPASAAPCYLPVAPNNAGRDEVTLGTLVQAAGASLDAVPSGSGTTFRYAGMVLGLQIEYVDKQHWSGPTADTRYAYKPQVERDDFRFDTITWLDYPASRVMQLRHGVQIAAMQTGALSELSLLRLLVQGAVALMLWYAGLGLLHLVALYALDGSRYYRRVVLEPTLDRDEMPQVIRASEAANALRAAALSAPDEYRLLSTGSEYTEDDSSSEYSDGRRSFSVEGSGRGVVATSEPRGY